ncbi:meu26 [Nucleospora cyclopteri]
MKLNSNDSLHKLLFEFEGSSSEDCNSDTSGKENINNIPNPLFIGKNEILKNKINEGDQSVICKSKIPYKPKLVRGDGKEREGMCEICSKWYKLKTSSYWYHMNYKHGISKNGNLFPKKFETRVKQNVIQGYCKLCRKWIDINSKNKNVTFGWNRHYQKWHSDSENKRRGGFY